MVRRGLGSSPVLIRSKLDEVVGIQLLLLQKSSPQLQSIRSFKSITVNFSGELFFGLAAARCVVDRWRLDYNHHRPHSSLEYQTRVSTPPSWHRFSGTQNQYRKTSGRSFWDGLGRLPSLAASSNQDFLAILAPAGSSNGRSSATGSAKLFHASKRCELPRHPHRRWLRLGSDQQQQNSRLKRTTWRRGRHGSPHQRPRHLSRHRRRRWPRPVLPTARLNHARRLDPPQHRTAAQNDQRYPLHGMVNRRHDSLPSQPTMAHCLRREQCRWAVELHLGRTEPSSPIRCPQRTTPRLIRSSTGNESTAFAMIHEHSNAPSRIATILAL